MPSRSRTSLGAHGRRGVDALALDLVGQQRRRGLADRAAAAGEPDAVDHAAAHPQLERDPIAAQRVRALLRGRGVIQHPEVVGAPVVLEDVVAVQVVHVRGAFYRPCKIPTKALGYCLAWGAGGRPAAVRAAG